MLITFLNDASDLRQALKGHNLRQSKKGKVKFPQNIGLPSGEADVIFLFPEGRSRNNLKKFIGCVNDKEAQEIKSIIAEDCERIEQDGW